MTADLRETPTRNSSLSCKNGIIPPNGCANTRNTADAVAVRVMRLDRPDFACSIKGVVAVPPQWTETHSLIRYPSPYGRSCTLRYRPPFFRQRERLVARRRRVAHRIGRGAIGFDLVPGMALNRAITKEKQIRGLIRCNSNQNSACALRPFLASPLVATPSVSKPLSARGRGPAQRPLSAAASPRAPLSARRAMSPIARPSRNAASTVSRALTGAAIRTGTTGAFGRTGGFFVANSVRSVARPMTDRGDEICSRRS